MLLEDQRGQRARARTAPWCSRTTRLLPWLTVYENVNLAVAKVFGRTKSQGRAA